MAETKAPAKPGTTASPQKGATAPPPPSARPGTEDTTARKQKKEKVPRVPYPGLKDAEGKDVKLKGVPEDFDPKRHKPLKMRNFENPVEFLEQRAKHYEELAVKTRQEAAEWRAAGGAPKKSQVQAKKLAKMLSSIEQLKKELVGELGEDQVAAIIKAAQEGVEKKGAPAAQSA